MAGLPAGYFFIEPMHPLDYLYIRAWGKLVGDTEQEIDRNRTLARQQLAPQDATYFNVCDGCWVTVSSIRSHTTLADLEAEADSIRRRYARGQSL